MTKSKTVKVLTQNFRELAGRLEKERKELEKQAKKGLTQVEGVSRRVQGQLDGLRGTLIAAVGLATHTEIDRLTKRVATLTKRLDELEKHAA